MYESIFVFNKLFLEILWKKYNCYTFLGLIVIKYLIKRSSYFLLILLTYLFFLTVYMLFNLTDIVNFPVRFIRH